MICRYCELIHSKDESYPLREATRDLNSDFPRCDWHWRYVCDICGKPRHFNGTTWCEKAERFICINCGRDHRFPKGGFWNWDAYYAIGCPHCDARHPALDRLEFQGEHPWQLHPEMFRESVGLSDENDTRSYAVIRHFLPEGDVVSDKTVGEAWDRGADIWYSRYTDFGDLNRQYVIDPAILKMLGRVEGKRILDAGCGNGYLCRLLSKKGAEMVGVDVSKRAIEIAEDIEKNESMNIRYHVGSVCNLSTCSDATFDAVVSNLVLQDLQNIDKAVKELHRVLKREGKLVFSIMHPCFSSAPVHGWVRKPVDSNRKEDRLYWKVDRYFDRSIEEWTYFDLPPIYSFHRPL
ncbi:MAG: methyltransferase domain-containing protein [Candidatus Bathyarchaeota archaeon]|nr:methyltransferase domain-containing protein [Candidatus Bathyarchaeota archaeon]